jgi:hypothetical protein
MPNTLTITLSPNTSFVATATDRTLCLAITNTEGNNGASHHFEITSHLDSSLSGPF